MISYEMYKVLHLSSIFLFLMLATASFFQAAPSKLLAAASGISGVLILVFGMGLLARIGLTQSMPTWVIAKIVVWLVILAGGHIIAKRVKNPCRVGIPFLLILGTIAVYFALFKPGAV